MEINSDSVIIEGAVSVKNKQGRCNRQLYRINMFNTTSRIDANGRELEEFIQNHIETICSKIKDVVDYKYVNRKIAEICRETLTSTQTSDTTEVIQRHKQHKGDKTEIKWQSIQYDQNTNNLPEIENNATGNIDNTENQEAMNINMYSQCVDEEIDMYQREGIMETSQEIVCHHCDEQITGDTPAIECQQCTNWYHETCVNGPVVHLDNYICTICRVLDETLLYSET